MSKVKHVDFDSLNVVHCTLEDLPNALETILSAYADEVASITEKEVKNVTKKTVKVVKKAGGYKDRRPKYRKSIRSNVETSFNGTNGLVYAGGHEYSLTHLLENGHKLWNTPTRSPAFEHWKVGEKFAQEELPKAILNDLKKG